VTGYRPATIAACKALNVLGDGSERSPLVLCQPSVEAFGSRLVARLQTACAGGSPPTSDTAELAHLLPQVVNMCASAATQSSGL